MVIPALWQWKQADPLGLTVVTVVVTITAYLVCSRTDTDTEGPFKEWGKIGR